MDQILIPFLKSGRIRIDLPSEAQMTALASAWNDGCNHQIVFADPAAIRGAASRPEYLSMLLSADLVLTESDAFLRSLDAKYGRKPEDTRSISIPGEQKEYISWIEEDSTATEKSQARSRLETLSIFLSALEPKRGSVFLVGGSLKVLQRAEANVRATFPGLRVVGRAEGDLGREDEGAVLRALQKASPDFVIVGSGMEAGELWIPRHLRYLKSGIFMFGASMIETLAGRHP